jgi:hypothetical protein
MLRPGAAAVVLVGACLACSGCRDQPAGLYNVRGTVEFRGGPVTAGEVVIEPDPALGNRGPQARCPIRDGRFSTRPQFGAPAHAVIVTVTGYDRPPTFDTFFGKLFEPYVFSTELPARDSNLDIVVPVE